MKVKVTKRDQGLYDVQIRRTRRSEGNSVRAKGLSRAELRSYLEVQVEKIAHPDPVVEPG